MAPQRLVRAGRRQRSRHCAGRLARAASLLSVMAASGVALVAPLEPGAAPRAGATAGVRPRGPPPEPVWATSRARRDCGLGLLVGLCTASPSTAVAAKGSAIATIRAARDEVAALVESYKDIIKDGPDAVRRRLGTVGNGGASVIFPGPGKPGALDSAYKAVASETSDTELLELADVATGHLAKADEIAYSIFFVNDGGMRGSKKCKGGDCRPVFYEDARLELVAGLRALDEVLRSVQT